MCPVIDTPWSRWIWRSDAALGAFIGFGGTWLRLRHERRTRWDEDKRAGYIEFLALIDEIQTLWSDLIWELDDLNDDTSITEEFWDYYDGFVVESRTLADRLQSVKAVFTLYAPGPVIEAVQDIIALMARLPKIDADLVDAEKRAEAKRLRNEAAQDMEDAIEAFAVASRSDLGIPLLG